MKRIIFSLSLLVSSALFAETKAPCLSQVYKACMNQETLNEKQKAVCDKYTNEIKPALDALLQEWTDASVVEAGAVAVAVVAPEVSEEKTAALSDVLEKEISVTTAVAQDDATPRPE